MIDTIRFKIPVSQKFSKQLKKNSFQTVSIDHRDSFIKKNFFNSSVHIGSFSRDLNIFYNAHSSNFCFVELSLPKYFYGHNIFLLYESQLAHVITLLYKDLKKHFSLFPNPIDWEIQRLDLCYAWKFQSDDEASKVLDIIKAFDYPRKRTYRYHDSVMYIGSTYTAKWYLKSPEFFKHDFKSLNKVDPNLAHQFYSFSRGVLRFEVTLRKSSFKQYFGKKDLIIFDLYSNDLEDKLRYFFDKSILFDGKEINNFSDVFQKLESFCKRPQDVSRLFNYYVALNSSDYVVRENAQKSLSRSQIYRNNQLLKKAGISFLNTTSSFFDLAIPSQFATSFDPQFSDL